MTTDPRLIECAKALTAELGSMGRVFDEGQAEELALACVLRWLEQPETFEMRGAAQQAFVRGANKIGDHYAAMCAQAKIELSAK